MSHAKLSCKWQKVAFNPVNKQKHI